MAEKAFETRFEELSNREGVRNVVLFDAESNVVKSTASSDDNAKYVKLLSPVIDSARNAVDLIEKSDDLTLIRITTTKGEIVISSDSTFYLAVIHNATDESS